ncbi:MAG: YfaZ family protein [Gammaproteobacteria bacterium]|nr:YfaZ family protein [Gammaproteobacteria bacterium]
MLRKALIFVLAIAPVSTAFAGAIDFRLGSHIAELAYMKQDATFGYGGADMGLGLFLNDNDDLMVSGAILVSGSAQGDVKGLHFGVGAKVYAGILDFPSPRENQNGAALAIGAQMRYVFPGKTPFAILIEGFGAPDVTSASDFKGVTEIRLAVELEVTPSARAYIGYRTLEVKLNNGFGNQNSNDYELDDRGHVGVRFSF